MSQVEESELKDCKFIKARHILNEKPALVEEALDKIEEQFLSKGLQCTKAFFSNLAKKYSTCKSKKKGGDLGFFKKGVMEPKFEKTAWKLREKEVSKVFKTKFGYHIIWCEKRSDRPK